MASPPPHAATRTSPPTSINPQSTSLGTPLPTRAPVQDHSTSQQRAYRAYAILVEEVRDRQVILQNNADYDSEFQSPPRSSRYDKGKGKAVDSDSLAESRERTDQGVTRRRSGRRGSSRTRTRRGLSLELGLVDNMDDARRSLEKRLPMAEGYPSCNYVGNGILSCYPESNTTIVQGNYSKFIWNAQFPTFIGAGDVDIYLYNANTEEIATSWLGVQNARGMIGITPDDEWWPEETASEWFNSNENRTIPYYFIVVDGGSQLTGGETHQSTFTVIQTAPPSSLSSTLALLTASSLSSVSSVSSVSAASASSLSSVLSQSSASLASSTSTASGSRSTNANGELQPSNDSGGGGPAIPKWAIAIIVILGFFALVAGAFAIVFCLGRSRKRRRQQEALIAAGTAQDKDGERQALGGGAGGGGGEDGFSNSNGSREPILGSPNSPTTTNSGSGLAPAVLGAGAGGAALGALAGRDREKEEVEEDEKGGLDRNDAARMAEAFRAALRRPEFPHNGGTESSGESGATGVLSGGAGGNQLNEDVTPGEGEDGKGRELIEEELRSEGMSMRDVEGGGGKRWG